MCRCTWVLSWAVCLAIGWAVLKSRNPHIAAKGTTQDKQLESAGQPRG